ncbi:MAG: superinfection immunity protein [Rubrobacter sp.]|nr:superinfection immunity protein [Rubrobacter sp.]
MNTPGRSNTSGAAYPFARTTLQSPEKPPPPTGDDSGGGDDREEHKLALLYCLSYFYWARLLALRRLTEMPRGYIAELLEELEDEGLVSINSDPQARQPWLRELMNRIKRAIFRRRKPLGQELRIALTEAGWAHPPLVEVLEEDEKEYLEKMNPPRWQLAIFMGTAMLIMALVACYVVVSIVDIFYQADGWEKLMEAFSLMLWLVVVAVFAGVFFLPTFIALIREHPSKLAIFVLNLLSLITVFTWFAALVWAVLPVDRVPARHRRESLW